VIAGSQWRANVFFERHEMLAHGLFSRKIIALVVSRRWLS